MEASELILTQEGVITYGFKWLFSDMSGWYGKISKGNKIVATKEGWEMITATLYLYNSSNASYS